MRDDLGFARREVVRVNAARISYGFGNGRNAHQDRHETVVYAILPPEYPVGSVSRFALWMIEASFYRGDEKTLLEEEAHEIILASELAEALAA